MNFKYVRTGGFANVRVQREFDSDSLPANYLTTLNQLLKSKSNPKPSAPDEFIHELHASNKTLRFLDSQLSPEAIAFFEFLASRR